MRKTDENRTHILYNNYHGEEFFYVYESYNRMYIAEDIRKNMKNEITIYRGSHQIGGCVTEIKTENHRIVIDFGQNLPDSKTDDVKTDEELLHMVFNGKPCDGVLFTHYHGDHIGMYKNIPRDIPQYIGSTAKKILEILTRKLDTAPQTAEKGLPRIQRMKEFSPGRKISEFGDIQVTPFVVDHSALDAYMFLIEIDGKKILFTGDFREHGIAGERNTLEKLINAYIGKVDILITEGTMLSRREEMRWNPIQTERDLGRRARELFQANKESVILVSSTNLDSIMEFYHALPWGMDFVCSMFRKPWNGKPEGIEGLPGKKRLYGVLIVLYHI